MQTTSGLTQPTKLASALNRRDGIRVVDGRHRWRRWLWSSDRRAPRRYSARVPTVEAFGPDALRETIIVFRDAMQAHAPTINRLNVYPVPDGDTGTNMARTLDAVVESLRQAAPELAPTCAAISHGSLMGARGNSGVILSQILRGVASTLRDGGSTVTAEALGAAAAAAYQAVLRPIEGTILTVVRESAEAGGGLPRVMSPPCCAPLAPQAVQHWRTRPSCCRC